MTNLSDMGRLLLVFGAVLVAVGLLLLVFGRIPLLDRLPGNFTIRRGGFTLFIPILASIVLSIVLTVVLNLVLLLLRRH